MTFSKIAALSVFLASTSCVAGHGYVSSILADGQKYAPFKDLMSMSLLGIITDPSIAILATSSTNIST